MNNQLIEKVRIIVVGDSGVGKTSLVNLIANEEAQNPGKNVNSKFCSASPAKLEKASTKI